MDPTCCFETRGNVGGEGGRGAYVVSGLKNIVLCLGVPKQREVIGSCKTLVEAMFKTTLVEAMFKTQYGYVLCGGGSVVRFARVGELVIVNTHRLLNP